MPHTQAVKDFIQQLQARRLCLHPTDTLPGLAFDPLSDEALSSLLSFKGRAKEKSFIGLTANHERALEFYAPMPEIWQKALKILWPAPLSVIYNAAGSCPAALLAEDGSVALRVPRLKPQDAWFHAVLESIAYPLPTTSVNHSGNQPLSRWQEAIALSAGREEIYVPPLCAAQAQNEPADEKGTTHSQPSTLIKVDSNGGFTILRQGAVKAQTIDAALAQHSIHMGDQDDRNQP